MDGVPVIGMSKRISLRPVRSTRIFAVLVLIAVLGGCISRTRVLPPGEAPLPRIDASRAELLSDLRQASGAIESVNATVALSVSSGSATGVLTSYREIRGFLLVRRPLHIRLQGESPLAFAQIFDMMSDGEMFRVWIPPRNEFFTGANDAVSAEDNPVLNLRPQHIMEALFVDVREYLDDDRIMKPVLEELTEGRRSFYILTFIDDAREVPEIVEKVWIDRFDLNIVRKQVFGDDGVIQTDAIYSGHHDVGGLPFPREITIERPVEDYSVRIRFEATRLNEGIDEERFRLEAPRGAERIEIGRTGSGN